MPTGTDRFPPGVETNRSHGEELESVAHLTHLDYLPGTFFGPSTLVEVVRHRARNQPKDTAFIYLVDGETSRSS